MLVVFHGLDRPDTADLRASTRAEHVAFHAERGNLVGGPLRDPDGEVCGTVIIFEATDLATATADMDADPYVREGVFERTSITELVVVDWPRSDRARSAESHGLRSRPVGGARMHDVEVRS